MGARCPFPACECLHVGCVDGWFEKERSDGTPYVQPCPQCRPEVAAHLRMAPGSAAQVRAGLRTLPRPSRVPAKTNHTRKV